VNSGKRKSAKSWTVARFVGWLVLAGIIAVLAIGAATTVLGRKAGEKEAIEALRAKTINVAQLRVQPAIGNGLLNGNINAVAEVGAAVRQYVLNDSLVHVKIRNGEGTTVYSDDDRLIGENRPLSPADLVTLQGKAVPEQVSVSSAPSSRFSQRDGKQLAVYVPVLAPNGERLLFQAYYDYDAVTAAGTDVWERFAPIALGALVVLAVVLIIVASLLARRLRRRGVVVPEAGPEVDKPEPDETTPEQNAPEGIVLAAPEPVEAPAPDPGTQLLGALEHLVARANRDGTPATLDTDNVRNTIPVPIAEMLYRATKESLRDVPTNGHTTPVAVRVSDRDHIATLDVAGGRADPRALTDLVADSGGHLLVDAAGGATRVHVEVPLH
jgi:hypothetical protein